MASVKFTKECIDVETRNIKHYANELLVALMEKDTYESLSDVERYKDRIKGCIDSIEFRLSDCNEY